MDTALRAHTLASIACACSLACGGSSQAIRPTEPLTPEQVAVWNDGADLIENPDLLQDQWRTQWIEDTRQLAQESQLIARGTVSTLRTEQDPDQNTTIHVVLRVEKVLIGEQEPSELVLRSKEGALGHAGIEGQRERLLSSTVIAFVRYVKEGTSVVPHFRLVRPSTPVLAAIDRRLGKDQPHRVQIVEHTQE